MTLSCSDATTGPYPANSDRTGNCMRSFSTARSILGAALFSILCGLQPALAQPAAPPTRPTAPVRPAAARPVPALPGAAPTQTAAPAPRGGAACHAGMTFDRFLADLKQQAVAAGVSQRALAEASPYLVY